MRCLGYGAAPLTDGVVAGSMGMCRGLASETLRCLGTGGSVSAGASSFPQARTRHLTAVDFASSPGSNINEEGSCLAWDGDWVEHEGTGGVDASRRGICWVFCAWYISCMYRSAAILRKLEDVSENIVGGPVGTTLFPPPLDDSPVVSVYDDMVALA